MSGRLKKLTKILANFSVYDWLAVGLVIVAAVLRLYNLEGSQQFLGDQGRDSMIVSRIFKEADPVFIGPVTSIGNMYLGPLYYYFMLPFLWLSYPSPMGPIYAVAILGIITVGVLYIVGKRMLGERAALVAAAFLTFSSAAIIYTRFSWNPNPAPLPGLLMVYFTYLAWKKSPWYWVGVAAMFSILIQLHYVALISAGGAGIIWLVSLVSKIRQKKPLSDLIFSTFGAVVVIGLFLLPLVFFDIKHDWLNARAFKNLFVQEQAFEVGESAELSTRVVDFTENLVSKAGMVWTELHFGKSPFRTVILLVSAFIGGAWLFKSKNRSVKTVLSIYLLVTIGGITFYRHDVFMHYILFIFPVVFLLFGGFTDYIIRINKYLGFAVVALVFALFLNYNFQHMPHHDAGWQISDISRTADEIAKRVEPGEKYNIVLLSETGDILGQNYRYFLTTKEGKEPINPEYENDFDTLYIINEEGLENPTSSPIYEIVIMPNKEPVETFTIPDGPEIIVLSK